jgi:hypothetical protein
VRAGQQLKPGDGRTLAHYGVRDGAVQFICVAKARIAPPPVPAAAGAAAAAAPAPAPLARAAGLRLLDVRESVVREFEHGHGAQSRKEAQFMARVWALSNLLSRLDPDAERFTHSLVNEERFMSDPFFAQISALAEDFDPARAGPLPFIAFMQSEKTPADLMRLAAAATGNPQGVARAQAALAASVFPVITAHGARCAAEGRSLVYAQLTSFALYLERTGSAPELAQLLRESAVAADPLTACLARLAALAPASLKPVLAALPAARAAGFTQPGAAVLAVAADAAGLLSPALEAALHAGAVAVQRGAKGPAVSDAMALAALAQAEVPALFREALGAAAAMHVDSLASAVNQVAASQVLLWAILVSVYEHEGVPLPPGLFAGARDAAMGCALNGQGPLESLVRVLRSDRCAALGVPRDHEVLLRLEEVAAAAKAGADNAAVAAPLFEAYLGVVGEMGDASGRERSRAAAAKLRPFAAPFLASLARTKDPLLAALEALGAPMEHLGGKALADAHIGAAFFRAFTSRVAGGMPPLQAAAEAMTFADAAEGAARGGAGAGAAAAAAAAAVGAAAGAGGPFASALMLAHACAAVAPELEGLEPLPAALTALRAIAEKQGASAEVAAGLRNARAMAELGLPPPLILLSLLPTLQQMAPRPLLDAARKMVGEAGWRDALVAALAPFLQQAGLPPQVLEGAVNAVFEKAGQHAHPVSLKRDGAERGYEGDEYQCNCCGKAKEGGPSYSCAACGYDECPSCHR